MTRRMRGEVAAEQSATSTASAVESERGDQPEDVRTGAGKVKRGRVRQAKRESTASKAKPARESKRVRAQSARPRRRFGLLTRLAAVSVALAVGAAGIWLFTRATAPKAGLSAADIPALQVQAVNVRPGSAVPKDATVAANIRPRTQPPAPPQQQPHAQGNATGHNDPLTGWATTVSASTGIPETALWAYGDAELVMRAVQPGCHLSWTTLAGIGRVESNHGQFGGAQLQPNGEESKPIIGVPLDGSGDNRAVGDTDHGALDGDPTTDHAVGPMQFLPSTWRNYASDGNGDGKADPENIDDAALTTARYLCVGGRDMGTPQGWWAGLFSYNNSVEYGQKVFGLAEIYGKQAQQATQQ